jgi:hypothetical protein
MSINMSIHALANLIEGPPSQSSAEHDADSGPTGEMTA